MCGHSQQVNPRSMDNFLPFQEARENGGITEVPSGKHTKNHGTSPFLMGKSTINGYFQ